MKNLTLLCLLIFSFSMSVFAQETEVKVEHENQIAINATNFIQTLVSLNGSTFNNTPYDFQYKYLYWRQPDKYAMGIRSGMGYRNSTANTDQPNSNASSSSKTIMLDLRIGAEFQFVLNKRWNFFTGVDYLYGKTDMRGTSVFKSSNNQIFTSSTTDYRERTGFGPLVGIQFNINKRLALGTEMTLYTITETMTRRSTSSSSPNFEQVLYSSSKTSQVQVPSFIYFIVRL